MNLRTLRTSIAPAAAAAALLVLAGCGKPAFQQDLQLGGKTVSAAELNSGKEEYTLYCRTCHGDDGKGTGASAPGLRPPPRDFTQAQFKFGWVVDGLPHDDDFERIITSGLHGTAMLPWDVPNREMQPIIQYIKTFNVEEWRDGQLGEQVKPGPDPWKGREAEAVEHGKTVYHGVAQCSSCHPAYATKDFIYTTRGNADFRPNMYMSERKESQYRHEDHVVSILPPDFTWNPLRSIRPESQLQDLYSLIGAGIPGTAMPSWKGSLSEEDLWSLAYYVDSLVKLRDTQQATDLRQQLGSQPEFVPPVPPPVEGAAAPTTSGL